MDCVFCKIKRKEIPADLLYEDADILVFPDINPVADVHLLIVPRKHIRDINGLKAEDEALYGKIVRVASKMAAKKGVADSGWQLFVRVGKGGGQEVPHVHFHLVSGKHC